MSRVSGTSSPFFIRDSATSAKTESPADALRHLELRGPAGKPWRDILNLSGGDLGAVVRAIDAEGQALQHSYAGASTADTTLTTVTDTLKEIDTLVADSATSGASRQARRQNQRKIDDLLEQIDKTLEAARDPDGARLFDGRASLTTGSAASRPKSLDLGRVALSTLGRLASHGRSVNLSDLAERGPLDASRAGRRDLEDAREVISRATDAIQSLQEEIRGFQKDELIPRLGEVATTMEGLYDTGAATRLGSAESAQEMAKELRQMMLDSATVATAVGADGWDRARTLALVK